MRNILGNYQQATPGAHNPGGFTNYRTAEQQERDILNHQHRIDLARDAGMMLDESPEVLRSSEACSPGYSLTPRGVQLGTRHIPYRRSSR